MQSKDAPGYPCSTTAGAFLPSPAWEANPEALGTQILFLECELEVLFSLKLLFLQPSGAKTLRTATKRMQIPQRLEEPRRCEEGDHLFKTVTSAIL